MWIKSRSKSSQQQSLSSFWASTMKSSCKCFAVPSEASSVTSSRPPALGFLTRACAKLTIADVRFTHPEKLGPNEYSCEKCGKASHVRSFGHLSALISHIPTASRRRHAKELSSLRWENRRSPEGSPLHSRWRLGGRDWSSAGWIVKHRVNVIVNVMHLRNVVCASKTR